MKTRKWNSLLAVAMIGTLLTATLATAQYTAPAGSPKIEQATQVLNEFMAMPNGGIPRSMLQKAQGIVIVPNMIKVGFVVGGRHGEGIAVVRSTEGAWMPPSFVNMTGGSVGFQAGVQSADVVLVFNTRKSVDGLLSGNFTIGVDATAAAGPVGRQAAAATDGQLKSEIYSYSRARGLFAGASVDGSAIKIDYAKTENFYRAAGVAADGTPIAPNGQLPLPAAQFLASLGTYSGAPVLAPGNISVPAGTAMAGSQPAAPYAGAPVGSPPATAMTAPSSTVTSGNVLPQLNGGAGTMATSLPAPPAAVGSPAGPPTPIAAMEQTRTQLSQAGQELGNLLDEQWRTYLALPKGVFTGEGTPTVASLQEALQRFNAAAADSRYSVLQARPEFQRAYNLLRQYVAQVEAATLASPSAQAGTPSAVR